LLSFNQNVTHYPVLGYSSVSDDMEICSVIVELLQADKQNIHAEYNKGIM